MGSFTIYHFQPKNICLLPNMNVKLLGTLAFNKRNSEVLTLSRLNPDIGYAISLVIILAISPFMGTDLPERLFFPIRTLWYYMCLSRNNLIDIKR